jgi:hypothetical protein
LDWESGWFVVEFPTTLATQQSTRQKLNYWLQWSLAFWLSMVVWGSENSNNAVWIKGYQYIHEVLWRWEHHSIEWPWSKTTLQSASGALNHWDFGGHDVPWVWVGVCGWNHWRRQ